MKLVPCRLISILVVSFVVSVGICLTYSNIHAQGNSGNGGGGGTSGGGSTLGSNSLGANAGTGILWSTEGNMDTDPSLDFLGTTDAADLVIKTNSEEKVRVTTDGNVEVTGTLNVTGGDAADDTPGKDITIQAQNGGVDGDLDGVGGAGGNIILQPGVSVDGVSLYGNVGVGVTVPVEKLDVNGNVQADSFIGIGTLLTQLYADQIVNFESATNYYEKDPTVDLAKLKNLVSDDFHTLGGTDTDTQLSESEVDAFVSNNNYSIGDHTVDTDTQLSESEVDAFVSNNNYSIGDHAVDTDTQLSESEVDAFVSNNDYLKTDGDGSDLTGVVTTEDDPEVGDNTTNYFSKWDGSKLVTGTIFDNGNIGIGTDTPSVNALDKLTVAGNIVPAAHDEFTLGTDNNRWKDVYVGNNSLHIGDRKLSNDGGTLFWNNQSLSGMWSAVNGGINYDGGKVGIGTSGPVAKLDVRGNMFVDNGASTNLDLKSSTGETKIWAHSDTKSYQVILSNPG